MKFRYFILPLGILAACSGNGGDVKQPDTPVTLQDTGNINATVTDTIVGADGEKRIVHYDCSVLKRRIPPDTSLQNLKGDLDDLKHCGIDSFDFRYVVPNLLPGYIGEERVKGNDTMTYGDFVRHLNEFRTTDSYYRLHLQITTLDSLRTVPFDARKLYAMKSTFGKLGMTEPEWNAFFGFARTYPVPQNQRFTWGDMMDAFETYYSTVPGGSN